MTATPTTGRTNSTPTTASASQPAVTMTSLPRYVPATVPAPITGSATAIAARTGRGVPPEVRLTTDVAGISRRRHAGRDGPASEHFLEERGNVVAAAVQHRAHESHPVALEGAARTLDVGHARRVGLDHDDGGIEPGAEDDSVAVDVDRWQVEKGEVEVLAYLGEHRGQRGRIEQGSGRQRAVAGGNREQVRDGGRLGDVGQGRLALDHVGEPRNGADAEGGLER